MIQTTVATTTTTICPETLTIDPSSTGPLTSVRATLTGAQPEICTRVVVTTVTHHLVPTYKTVFDPTTGTNILVQDGYVDQPTTTVSEQISCVSNTAAISFAGADVATATPTADGLSATFTVPNVRPGTYAVTATPRAGVAASASFSVLDTIPPFISGVRAPDPNAAGWNSGDVIVEFACIDADSAIASCTDPVTVSSEGAGQSVTGTAVDAAGNRATLTVGGINIDRTGPTIDAHASRPPDHGTWYTAPVTISFDCADALSGVAFCSAPVTLSTDGRGVLYGAEAFDKAGNGLQFFNNLNIDQTPPTISAPPAVITATSPGSCAASPTLGSPAAADNLGVVITTNDALASFPRGTTTVTWTAMDPAGHTAAATQLVTVNDLERPVVVAPPGVHVIATGASGAVIATAALGSATVSDNCPGAGSASVSGTPAGNLFPIGATTLTWTATDANGNTGSATQTVTVSYGVCPLYDPTKAAQPGSTIPIKLQLCAASGANQSAPTLIPSALTVGIDGSTTTVPAIDAGGANPNNDFRYDASLGAGGGYIFNLSTKGLSSGAWHLTFMVNGQTYNVAFRIR